MQAPTYRQGICLKLIVIVLLCVMTVGLFGTFERYESAGENILKNAGFQQGLKNWGKAISGRSISVDSQGVLRIRSQNGQEVTGVRQHVKNIQRYRFLRFTGKMRTEGVEQGKKRWQAAHLLVIGINAKGQRLWQVPYLFAKQHGTNDWQHYEQVFKLNEDAEEFLVDIQLPMVKGTVWVKDLNLRPVTEKPAYTIYRTIAIALWLMVLFWILTDYIRNYGYSLKQAPIAFILGGVSIGVLIPHHFVMRLNDFLLSLSPWTQDAVFLDSRTGFANVYSLWHFLAFLLLALVAWRMTPPRRLAQSFGLLVLFALVTEVLQLLVDSRKSEPMDFFTNIAGIVTALVLWSVWRATRLALGRAISFLNIRQA